jgi:hypothetical protein
VKLLTLLIVMVVGVGGPHNHVRKKRLDVLTNSTITVSRYARSGAKVIATSDNGLLKVHLGSGLYKIDAVLHDMAPGETEHLPNCESKTVQFNHGKHRQVIALSCSIK